MGPVKRKSNSGETSTPKHPSKRLRTDELPHRLSAAKTGSTASRKDLRENEHSSSLNPISFPTTEQPAFPRGGANILTPIERRQIQAEAARDALKEHRKQEDLFTISAGGPDSSDEELTSRQIPREPKKSRRTKGKKLPKDPSSNAAEPNLVRIEGLTYRKIAAGSLILGQVTSINFQDVTIALPNNLVGYAPLTAISTTLTEKLQKLLEHDDDINEGEGAGEESGFNLSKYLRVGQYVRAAVTSTSEDSIGNSEKSKKRIELSLVPKLANAGLTQSGIVTGMTVQAAVTSVEDHGLVVDVGIESSGTRGFIPAQELAPDLNIADVEPGSVFLCIVTGFGANGKIIKLSAHPDGVGSTDKKHFLSSAPTIDSFLPGTAAEILLSEVTESGLAGKVMGMLDVTADHVHSGAVSEHGDLTSKYRPGSKIKGRLICTFPLADMKKLGFSLLENVLGLQPSKLLSPEQNKFPISSVVPKARVSRVEPGLGVYLDLGSDVPKAFAHISRLSDNRVDSISQSVGPFKAGTEHTGRVIDVSLMDNLYIMSLQEKVVKQRFLRVEDVEAGEVVKGRIEKILIGESGVKGLLVELSEGVSGLVPELHLSDVLLLHPEKKFREGMSVTARVLSTDITKQQIRLTLKKSLVNSEQKPWRDYCDIQVGDSCPGTLVKVEHYGAIVQFYGRVKGLLPVSEMSEAYIKDATDHFRLGQVVTVISLHVNAESGRLTVSCRDASSNISSRTDLSSLVPGSIVTGTVFEKAEDDLLLRLEGSSAIARLHMDHMSDGSLRKRQSTLKKIRVGQTLHNLLLWDVQAKRKMVVISNRASLVKASQDKTLITSFEDLKEGKIVTGIVSNITSDGVFVNFAGGLSGLIPRAHTPKESEDKPDFGMTKLQPVTTRVTSVDYRGVIPRFWLTMRDDKLSGDRQQVTILNPISEPVDGRSTGFEDFAVGKVTQARIVSVKETQINVELAKGIQGRIDVSEVFDSWSDIKDRKRPLRIFSAKTIIPVRVLGAHDARNHRFLPITHRAGKTPVLELSAKPSVIEKPELEVLKLEKIDVGLSCIAYVNNVADDCLWVNLSPGVRGRVRAVDVSDDLSLAANLPESFPVGSAMKAHVIAVDCEKGHLDLSGRNNSSASQLAMKDISKGMILPGRVTRVSERNVLVQLNDTILGAADLIDLDDNYTEADPMKYKKNDVVRVCIVNVDIPNKRINLSLRPSKVLSSSLPVVDPEVTSVKQLKVNDVYRGFVTNVTDKGLFVMLGHGVTGFVRVANLSDSYLKDWRDHFERDQLIKGKIILVDHDMGHIQMSLRESALNPDYVAPITFTDLKEGDVVTGKVVKVEEFGVFILVDNSANVRGLCHRSEIAEKRIVDASQLFNEGDAVKAKVLKIDMEKRRVNFGLKASYFINGDNDDDQSADVPVDGQEEELDGSNDGDEDSEIDVPNGDGGSGAVAEESDSESDVSPVGGKGKTSRTAGDITKSLKVGGFNWAGDLDNGTSKRILNPSDTEDERTVRRHKKARRPEIQIDRTGDLDKNGPQSIDDFERLLLGEPDSSLLWLQYMAFHLELGEIDQARQIGERGIRTVGLGQDEEKLNIWVALLNLENTYGDDETIEAMFKRACEYNDAQEIHARLASIYIQSGKLGRADELFQKMLKKFAQDPKVWVNYATFLIDTSSDAEKARGLLPRALQTLPSFTHVDVTSKFAQLEFRSAAGLPERGRTIFEGLLDSFPRRMDLWNVLLDLETKAGDKEKIRGLYARIFEGKVKTKQAKFFFKRWLAFEEKEGDDRSVDAVKAKAAEFVKRASGVGG